MVAVEVESTRPDDRPLTFHHGVLVRVGDHASGELSAYVHKVNVVDLGTGLGPDLIGRLTLAPDVLEGVVAGRPVAAGHDLDIALAHHDGGDKWIEVFLGWVDGSMRHTADDVPDEISSRLTRHLLHDEKDRPRIHAAAAVGEDGRAVVVVGASGAGKSTLAAQLVAGGHLHLVNDEQITIFTDHQLVGAFTRPIAIKPGGLVHLGDLIEGDLHHDATQLVTSEELGTSHALVGRPGLVVVLEREVEAGVDPHGAVRWELVDPLDAAAILCDNNLDLVTRPEAGLDAFGWLATDVPVVRLHYTSSRAAASTVRELLARPPAAAGSSWRVSPTATRDDSPTALVHVSAGVFELQVGDEALLFHERTREILTLNASGSAIFDLLPLDNLPGDDRLPGIESFLTDLSDRQFVEFAPEASTVATDPVQEASGVDRK